MKRKIALFCMAVLLILSVLTFSSCAADAADIKGAKVTATTLEFNFYEVTLIEKDDLAKYSAEDYLKAILKAENGDEKVAIYYCKSESIASTVLEYFKGFEGIEDDKYQLIQSGDIVFYGSEEALDHATRKSWPVQLYHTFIEEENYM